MKKFRFKQFEISQSPQVFRVGTDGVLLGASATIHSFRKALEIGTGTGLISLMLAQRNPELTILAIDINEEAAHLAQENFKNSPFSERLHAQLSDFNLFPTEENYDLVVSNPPYFEAEESKDLIARHQVTLNFEQLISKSAQVLTSKGILSVIIPHLASLQFEQIAEKHRLSLFKKIQIRGIEGGEIKRCILEFSKTKTEPIFTEFIIEDSPRKYSAQYQELTKDFHPMF
ncbi:tRNA1(Val) (adenine(37)-N6)-methyltransferase [Elizabethkingia sp. JS20170427COW]|uniref:tRNA1(Val) (adenine(37)-N6)-methyltransferase n=1 Tax=Elizabethkingia sp. JS20170427COW TaxID=2583851 RepID=UPI0011103D1E|nr:methyltransferase [Elizabethkingia sp. JS20170427COW]QCX53322.1 methyltransferase [Elizabethkingia sp. JS20170427COW]